MAKNVFRSKCCNAKVGIKGTPDFLGNGGICTVHYVCSKCNQPCDIAKPKVQKRKTPTAEKQIREQEKRLVFQGKVLQKLVDLLDGIAIDPEKGIILTPKKKQQLAEFWKLEQKLSKSKKPKPKRPNK